MSLSQEVVRAIQEVLVMDGKAEHAKLLEIAEAYTSACRVVNRRVQKCREFMANGQRNKALHLAKQDPDLRELFDGLDFGEAPAWLDLCERDNLPVPPLLDNEAINETLTDLYAESRGMEPLLRAYRKMAIGRAPLAERLRKLRQVFDESGRDEQWKKDVLEFETARMEELAKEAEAADSRGDLKEMEAIAAELASSQWLHPPSAKLIKAVQKLIAPHRQNRAKDQYARLLEQLREAHAKMDDDACRELMRQWAQLWDHTQCSPEEEIRSQVAAVESWLGELDEAHAQDSEFDLACAELERAIDDGKGIPILEKLAGAVLRCERGMPPLLAARFKSRMDELQREHRRSFTLRLTGISGAVAVVAACVGLAIWWYGRSQDTQRWREQVAAAVDKGDMDAAQQLFERMKADSPHAFQTPEIQGYFSQFQQKLQTDMVRKEAFQRAIAVLEAEGIVTSEGMERINAAVSLARTAKEKLLAEEWRQKRKVFEDAEQRKADQEFEAALAQISDQYAAVRRAYQSGSPEVTALAGECIDRCDKLANMTKASDTLKAKLKPMRQELAKTVEDVRQKQSRSDAIQQELNQLQHLVGRPSEFADAVAQFAAHFPEQKLGKDFAAQAALAPHLKAAGRWNALCAELRPVRVTDANAAETRFVLVRDYLREYPSSPYRVQAATYQEYLTSAKNAWAKDGLKHLKATKDLFSKPLLADLLMIQQKSGPCWYMLPQDSGLEYTLSEPKRCKFRYITNAACELSPAVADVRLDALEGLANGKPGPAPHTRLAKEAIAVLDKSADGSSWETLYLRVTETVRTQQGIDPILQATLIKMLCERAVDCTPFVTDSLKDVLKTINAVEVDLPWMNPDNGVANRARPQVTRMIQDLKSFKPWIQRIDQELDSNAKMTTRYMPVVVFLGQQEPLKVSIAGKGSLFTITATSDGMADFRPTGEYSDGQVTLEANGLLLQPGTLIFAKGK